MRSACVCLLRTFCALPWLLMARKVIRRGADGGSADHGCGKPRGLAARGWGGGDAVSLARKEPPPLVASRECKREVRDAILTPDQ
jgi:hypothetical protein